MFEDLPRRVPVLMNLRHMHGHASHRITDGEKFLISGADPACRPLPLPGSVLIAGSPPSDIHQPFLDDLIHRAKNAGLDTRIVTYRASMDNLPFNEASFDIIWSEGSAFIMGLSPALRYWKKFLQPDGYLVVSDCTWFTDAPSEECRVFLGEECPDMKSVPGTEDIIRSAGYTVISSFRLPDAGGGITIILRYRRRCPD